MDQLRRLAGRRIDQIHVPRRAVPAGEREARRLEVHDVLGNDEAAQVRDTLLGAAIGRSVLRVHGRADDGDNDDDTRCERADRQNFAHIHSTGYQPFSFF